MNLPTMPDNWWIAYIYPMHHLGTWQVDARSMTASAVGKDADLELAIAKVIKAIELGEITIEDKPKAAAQSLLTAIGLGPKAPIKRRRLAVD